MIRYVLNRLFSPHFVETSTIIRVRMSEQKKPTENKPRQLDLDDNAEDARRVNA
jgi:wyosine [tRNA(Phe)-imidazoG37] synthetase (radical SAM superfamily)